MFKITLAQIDFQKWNSVNVKLTTGQTLANPWAGGLFCPQFSSIDLNTDGKMDLFVFDRSNNKISCFINQGNNKEINYEYAPEYEQFFPKMANWALLRDFNGDGLMDIFCSNSEKVGISVYKNTSKNGSLDFQLEKEIIEAQFGNFKSSIYLLSIDIPSIIDVDEDGDLDILVFQSGSFNGDAVYLFKNYAKENFFNLDSLDFKREKQCWGKFRESADNCTVALNDTNGACKTNSIAIEETKYFEKTNRHAGSSLLVLDANGDGLLDLLAGDIACNKPYVVYNDGSNIDAHFFTVSTNFPSSHPIDIPVFPAFYYLDVNNDGLRDLIAAPNIVNASIDTGNVWLYLNSGTSSNPIFTFYSSTFLQNQMLDFGHGANPIFCDLNKDNKLDLLIGNYGYLKGSSNSISNIAFLKNIGTNQNPNYFLESSDYSNLSSNGLTALYPMIMDADQDSKLDLLCGNAEGKIYLFKNESNSDTIPQYTLLDPYYKNIDVGNFSRPSLSLVNKDSYPDLFIGEKDHGINFYSDSSLGNQNFKFVKSNFGNLHFPIDDFQHGFAGAYLGDINSDGKEELIYADKDGWIRIFNRDSNFLDSFTLIKSIDPKMGTQISMGLGDLDLDGKMDLAIGSYSGGISLFRQIIGTSIIEKKIKNLMGFKVFPNPSSEQIIIQAEAHLSNSDYFIMNALGETVMKINSNGLSKIYVSVQALKQGIYFIKNSNGIGLLKFVKI